MNTDRKWEEGRGKGREGGGERERERERERETHMSASLEGVLYLPTASDLPPQTVH